MIEISNFVARSFVSDRSSPQIARSLIPEDNRALPLFPVFRACPSPFGPRRPGKFFPSQALLPCRARDNRRGEGISRKVVSGEWKQSPHSAGTNDGFPTPRSCWIECSADSKLGDCREGIERRYRLLAKQVNDAIALESL
jgi:hypothetical protein